MERSNVTKYIKSFKQLISWSGIHKTDVRLSSYTFRSGLCGNYSCTFVFDNYTGGMHFLYKEVQVGKDQEKAQSEKDSHSKNRGGKKNKPTIRQPHHETHRKPNEQLFSQ